MTDIFREVDEDVRRDRALQFWTKYQFVFLAIAVVVVLATAGWRGYDTWRTRMAQSASGHFERALDLARDGNPKVALEEFDRLAAKAPAGYRVLARLRAASERAKTDAAAGAKAFDAIAADSSVDATLRDLARLRAALLLVDTADLKEIRNRLEPLAGPEGTFRATAREFLAIAALKANDGEQAGKWLDAIVVDPTSPSDVRGRAEALLGLVRETKPATG
jgi:hypothetical protein